MVYSVKQENLYDAMIEQNYSIQEEINNHIFCAAKADKDTMYFRQDTQKPDKDELLRSILREVNENGPKKHWNLIPKENILKGEPVLVLV